MRAHDVFAGGHVRDVISYLSLKLRHRESFGDIHLERFISDQWARTTHHADLAAEANLLEVTTQEESLDDGATANQQQRIDL